MLQIQDIIICCFYFSQRLLSMTTTTLADLGVNLSENDTQRILCHINQQVELRQVLSLYCSFGAKNKTKKKYFN